MRNEQTLNETFEPIVILLKEIFSGFETIRKVHLVKEELVKDVDTENYDDNALSLKSPDDEREGSTNSELSSVYNTERNI